MGQVKEPLLVWHCKSGLQMPQAQFHFSPTQCVPCYEAPTRVRQGSRVIKVFRKLSPCFKAPFCGPCWFGTSPNMSSHIASKSLVSPPPPTFCSSRPHKSPQFLQSKHCITISIWNWSISCLPVQHTPRFVPGVEHLPVPIWLGRLQPWKKCPWYPWPVTNHWIPPKSAQSTPQPQASLTRERLELFVRRNGLGFEGNLSQHNLPLPHFWVISCHEGLSNHIFSCVVTK